MIEKQTVLVLGAGASMPYGFPSGAGLRRDILNGLKKRSTDYGQSSPLARALVERGFAEEELLEFRAGLLDADTTSIDLFLAQKPRFSSVGKAAIAAVLIPLESEEALFEPWVNTTPEAQKQSSGAWYQYLADNAPLFYTTWPSSHLTILTYNYDRSLDHYLWKLICATSNESQETCWERYSQLRLIHLHGELGPYRPLDPEFLPFGSPRTSEIISRAATSIKVMHEVEPDDRLEAANEALDAAEVVAFLGFGYLRENLGRLRIKNNTGGRRVLGTTFNLTEAEQRRRKLGMYLDKVYHYSWDILRFLRETDVLG